MRKFGPDRRERSKGERIEAETALKAGSSGRGIAKTDLGTAGEQGDQGGRRLMIRELRGRRLGAIAADLAGRGEWEVHEGLKKLEKREGEEDATG